MKKVLYKLLFNNFNLYINNNDLNNKLSSKEKIKTKLKDKLSLIKAYNSLKISESKS